MVVDKSVELLEDLVRFLNRKQSFYLKLYDEYVNGDLSDYSHLDDSRKDETDCEGICEDLIECIKAISNEAQYRGFAKKEKLLCTIDGQDEAMYPFDEWLLKVVRLLDDKTIRLAPVEGEGINGAFYTILFRLTWYVNTLRDLATKTEDEYYGGRRTDVMPYYIGESKLKETSRMKEGVGSMNKNSVLTSKPVNDSISINNSIVETFNSSIGMFINTNNKLVIHAKKID